MRRVVVLFGPPGAGKTTAAHQAPPVDGIPPVIYDRDDAQWDSERQYTDALRRLATRNVYAIVVRTGATRTARAKAVSMVRATHAYMLDAPRTELMRRVKARGRSDMTQCLMALAHWDQRSDRDDHVPDFPGWDHVDDAVDVGRAITHSDIRSVTVRDL